MGFFPVLRHVNLPNLISSVSFCIGIIALILFYQENYKPALFLCGLTIMLDVLDGLAAKKLGLCSDFGAELDNLSDAINFAVIPALMAYFLGFNSPLAVCFLLLYVVSGVWRLANYSVIGLVKVGHKECFTGLCAPHATALVLVAICAYLAFFPGASLFFMYPLFFATAVLMNASFYYDKRGPLPKWLFVVCTTIVLLALYMI